MKNSLFITDRMHEIRNRTDYIPGTVHWHKRAYDKAFEIVGRLTPQALLKLDLARSEGCGEVVLDVRHNRKDALDSVRFFRRQENSHNA